MARWGSGFGGGGGGGAAGGATGPGAAGRAGEDAVGVVGAAAAVLGAVTARIGAGSGVAAACFEPGDAGVPLRASGGMWPLFFGSGDVGFIGNARERFIAEAAPANGVCR